MNATQDLTSSGRRPPSSASNARYPNPCVLVFVVFYRDTFRQDTRHGNYSSRRIFIQDHEL